MRTGCDVPVNGSQQQAGELVKAVVLKPQHQAHLEACSPGGRAPPHGAGSPKSGTGLRCLSNQFPVLPRRWARNPTWTATALAVFQTQRGQSRGPLPDI